MTAQARELTIMSWAGGWGRALEAAVSRPFEESTGVRVRHAQHVGLRLPTELIGALDRGEQPPFDVIWSNGVPAMRMARKGFCEPLDEERLPRLRQLAKRARPHGFAGWPLVFPYVVTYVLVYRQELYPERPPESWRVLEEPRHRGKIALYPGGNGFYPVAQLLGGGRVADIPRDMETCWAYLHQLAPQIGELDYSIGMGEQIASGRLDLCFRALTNALAFREEGLAVAWTAPREGVPDTLDALWLPRGLPEKAADLGRRYIDFALSEPVQRRWSELLGAMPMHRDVGPPQALRRTGLPTGPDDISGSLYVPETVKLEHELEWEKRFRQIVG